MSERKKPDIREYIRAWHNEQATECSMLTSTFRNAEKVLEDFDRLISSLRHHGFELELEIVKGLRKDAGNLLTSVNNMISSGGIEAAHLEAAIIALKDIYQKLMSMNALSKGVTRPQMEDSEQISSPPPDMSLSGGCAGVVPDHFNGPDAEYSAHDGFEIAQSPVSVDNEIRIKIEPPSDDERDFDGDAWTTQ